MDSNHSRESIHPKGERNMPIDSNCIDNNDETKKIKLDTYDGVIHLEWEPSEPLTPLGQLPFFIDFLKTSNLYNEWVLDCPLKDKKIGSNINSSRISNILGTLFLSTLSGQKRYSHITAIRNDSVNPPLLGMNKIISEDTARRAFKFENDLVDEFSEEWNKSKIEWENKCKDWMTFHINKCYFELMLEPWILDVDTTVKVIYGHQEGAEIGYNPQKPGRPAHIIHTYMMAETRIIMDAEVRPGKQSPANYTLPRLWELIDALPYNRKPILIRGDCAFGSDLVLSGAEKRNINYLFKIKKTKNVKSLINLVSNRNDNEWKDAGQGWYGIGEELQLDGWKRKRKVVVLRRLLNKQKGRPKKSDQLLLPFMNENGETDSSVDKKYEYSVLITNLNLSVFTIAQLYRDRASSENVFDELKNQWGWGGYVTQDILRTQITARIIALIYNWWTLFARFANPKKHSESITSKPLLLYAVGRKTTHSGQTIITVTPSHAKHEIAKNSLFLISKICSWFKSCAEQITLEERWCLILSLIFSHFLKGRIIGSIKNIPKEYYKLQYG